MWMPSEREKSSVEKNYYECVWLDLPFSIQVLRMRITCWVVCVCLGQNPKSSQKSGRHVIRFYDPLGSKSNAKFSSNLYMLILLIDCRACWLSYYYSHTKIQKNRTRSLFKKWDGLKVDSYQKYFVCSNISNTFLIKPYLLKFCNMPFFSYFFCKTF